MNIDKNPLPEEIILPPFADERNRKLAAEIAMKRRELAHLTSQTEEQQSRKKAMMDHMANIKQDIFQAQMIYESKKQEIETEKHLFQLSERENGQLVKAIKALDKDILEITENRLFKISELQGQIFTGSERVEALKQELNITKNEWETWLKANKDKDDDHLALEKYTKEDARRITDLTLTIQRLTHEVTKKKQELTQELTDAQLSRLEVEKTTENFRSLHLERQELLQQWEKTAEQVDNRNKLIDISRVEIQTSNSLLNDKRFELGQKRDFYEHLQDEIVEVEKTISTKEKSLAKAVTEQHKTKAELSAFSFDVESLRNVLKRTENSTKNQKQINSELEKDLEEKKARVQREKEKKAKAQDRLKQIQDEALTAQQKNAQLEKILQEEEDKKKKLEKILAEVKEDFIIRKKNYEQLKQDEKRLAIETTSSENSLKAIQSSNSKLEQQLIDQETLLYNHAFEVQQMERKIRRMQGERSAEEKELLNVRIKELENELESWMRKVSVLSNEYRQSTQDVKTIKKKLDKLQADKEILTSQLSELSLQVDSAASQLASKVNEKEDAIVEESMAKLELKKLRTVFDEKTETVVSAEIQQEQLRVVIEERMREIEAHKDILKMHAKVAEEERTSIASELRDRISKVEKIKNKYEVLMMTLGKPEDETEEVSQAYFILKAAQQKEDLKQQTLQEESNISHVETELKALEDTLEIMQKQNDTLRSYMKQRGNNGEDLEEKAQLEEKVKKLSLQYKEKKALLEAVLSEIKNLQEQKEELDETRSVVVEKLSKLQAEINKIEKELQDQQAKKERAGTQYEKIYSSWKSVSKSSDKTKEELDIELKELREENKALYAELLEITSGKEDISAVFDALCEKKGITPPSRASSVASNRASRAPSQASIRKEISRKAVPTPIMIGSSLDDALNQGSKRSPMSANNAWKPKATSPTKRRT